MENDFKNIPPAFLEGNINKQGVTIYSSDQMEGLVEGGHKQVVTYYYREQIKGECIMSVGIIVRHPRDSD